MAWDGSERVRGGQGGGPDKVQNGSQDKAQVGLRRAQDKDGDGEVDSMRQGPAVGPCVQPEDPVNPQRSLNPPRVCLWLNNVSQRRKAPRPRGLDTLEPHKTPEVTSGKGPKA